MKNFLFLACFWLCIGTAAAQNDTIQASQAREFVGKTVWVACDVKGFREAREAGKPNFINVGAAYPNHTFTVVVVGDFKEKHGFALATIKDKTIYVYGKVEVFKEVPQIKNPEKIIVK